MLGISEAKQNDPCLPGAHRSMGTHSLYRSHSDTGNRCPDGTHISQILVSGDQCVAVLIT